VQIRASVTPSQVGQQVTLDVHAVTDPQPTDAQWVLGDGTATGTSVTHTWNTADTFHIHVTAVFANGDHADADADQVVNPLPPVKVPVTVSVAGPGQVRSTPGGIACPPTCSTQFNENTNIRLTAQTTEQFDGFGGDCGGPTCQLTLGPGGASVTAHFTNVISNHTLTLHIKAGANGAIVEVMFPDGTGAGTECSDAEPAGTCTYTFKETDVIDLTPSGEPGDSAVLVGWRGACNNDTVGSACRVTMDRDRTVTALWVDCPGDKRCGQGGAAPAAAGPSSRRQSSARSGPAGPGPDPALPARRRLSRRRRPRRRTA
jgi:hypothetical protein